MVLGVTHFHNSCDNIKHRGKKQHCQCYEGYVCPWVNSKAPNSHDKHTKEKQGIQVSVHVLHLVSKCHTKVTRVWDTLKQLCWLQHKFTLHCHISRWSSFTCIGCLGRTHLDSVIHDACVMHCTPHRCSLCPLLSRASGLYDPNMGHFHWLHCVVCRLEISPHSDSQPVDEPSPVWTTTKSCFTTFPTLWLMTWPFMT